ncbi:MAG: L-fucose:H+ symporter permease [Bacteroidales bacterium]|nr:L-fucose:H+ symporter permease [Bacteroidales bacterium]
MTSKPKIVEKKILLPFIIITSLFSLWGFANDITNPLVAAFKDIMNISNARAALIQFAFYGGYATMAIPAALFIKRYSYKSGILLGLALYAAGALLFYPAARFEVFGFFLLSLYILTFGLAFLETTANPFILSMGDERTATRRLNLAQSFNPLGSILGMAVASNVILAKLQSGKATAAGSAGSSEPLGMLSDTIQTLQSDSLPSDALALHTGVANLPADTLQAMADSGAHTASDFLTAAQLAAQKAHDLVVIRNPYVYLGLVVLLIFVIVLVTKMPVRKGADHEVHPLDSFHRLIKIPKYREGVIAQAFYVGTQIMCWTFIIQYAGRLGIEKARAQEFNMMAMGTFISFRFLSTFLMKYLDSRKLLLYFALAGMITTTGVIFIDGMFGLYMLIATSAFMSLMFPTIYGIALGGVGDDATIGSAGLVMAIVGGALMPPLQGAIIDLKQVGFLAAENFSFILPFICFVVIAIYGYRASYVYREAVNQ